MATLVVHAGDQRDRGHNAIFPPICTATSFIEPVFNGESTNEFQYGRSANPTRYAYETALSDLEGGALAAATASGMAATSLALELLPANSTVVCTSGPYGGTHRLFQQVRKHSSGHTFHFVDTSNLSLLESSLASNPSMIWLESPTNPLLRLTDIKSACKIVKNRCPDCLICVDNTFATAWNQRPLNLGADLVMLSASKYIGGHSDLIGGALIAKTKELGEKIQFLNKSIGSVASPFDCYLSLRGMKTLDVRMERQCQNAKEIAKFLENDERLIEVHYPGLRSHSQHALCVHQMRSGGAVVTVRLHGEIEEVQKFASKLKVFVFAESLGGVESMINHAASMSHQSLSASERAEVGIFDSTLRLSIGLEDVDDLKRDLDFALGFT